MEFENILNSHLSSYVKSGASILGRLSFLISLFKEMKENNLDIGQHKEAVVNILKVNFFHKSLERLYDICVLRDIEKAIYLIGTGYIKIEKQDKTEKAVIKQESEEFPDDVPQIDREAFRNRKEQVDFDFLKSLGTDLEYLKSLGYEE